MAKMIKTTFRLKRGDASVWATKNPVLDPGEPGFEIDTGKLKIGNGETEWINLPYINTANGESTPTPGEDESAGVFYFDVEIIQDEQDEDKFEANITESIENIVSAYNEGKQIFAKCQYGNEGSFTTISLFPCQAIGKQNSEVVVLLFSGMDPNTGGQAILTIQLQGQSTTTQFDVAQFATEKNVEELEDSVDSLQSTVNTLQSTVDNFPSGEGDNSPKIFSFLVIYYTNEYDQLVISSINKSFSEVATAYQNGQIPVAELGVSSESINRKLYLSKVDIGSLNSINNLYFTTPINFEGQNLDSKVIVFKYSVSDDITDSSINEYTLARLDYITTLQSDINNKVDKVSGRGLSTEDYTTAEKNKLAGIDMTTKANVTDLGDLAYRSLGAVSDSNTTSPPSGAAVKEAIDAATSEVGSFVEDAINQAIIGAMNASY